MQDTWLSDKASGFPVHDFYYFLSTLAVISEASGSLHEQRFVFWVNVSQSHFFFPLWAVLTGILSVPPFLRSIQHSWPRASGHPLLQQFLVFGEVIVPVCDK